MTVKSPQELAVMRQAGLILAETLTKMSQMAEPGMSLLELDRAAEKLIKKRGAEPAFKGYKGYAFATCLSVNEEVVHGLPRAYRLKEGDLLGIDIGVRYKDLYVDSAITVAVGQVSDEDTKLLRITNEALWIGIGLVKPGVRLGDIQAAIQRHVEEAGLTIVRDLCGHGIGKDLQEEPQIPNFGKEGTGMTLQADYTFALEPMVTYSAAHTATKADGWTVVTLDGKKAAHFEHTVAVTEDGVEVLTLRRGEKGKRRFPSQGRPLTKVTDSYKMGGA